MKLFLDANILFSAAYKAENKLTRLWEFDKHVLISSDYAIQEAKRNLRNTEQQLRLTMLIKALNIVIQYFDSLIPAEIQLREKDRPILAAAIAAKADYLITGDYRDFGSLFEKEIAGVTIVPPALIFKLLFPN